MPQRVKIMTFKLGLLYSGSCNMLHLPGVTSSASLCAPLVTSVTNAEQAYGKLDFGFIENKIGF